jgi:hypothetical protein
MSRTSFAVFGIFGRPAGFGLAMPFVHLVGSWFSSVVSSSIALPKV